VAACAVLLLLSAISHWFEASAWVPALLFAALTMLAQSLLLRHVTADWDQRYLWLCYDKHVEEEMFLPPEGKSTAETLGRIATIKRHVVEQCKLVRNAHTLQQDEQRDEFRLVQRVVALQHRELQEVRQTLARLTEAVARSPSVSVASRLPPAPMDSEGQDCESHPDSMLHLRQITLS